MCRRIDYRRGALASATVVASTSFSLFPHLPLFPQLPTTKSQKENARCLCVSITDFPALHCGAVDKIAYITHYSDMTQRAEKKSMRIAEESR